MWQHPPQNTSFPSLNRQILQKKFLKNLQQNIPFLENYVNF
jgi:hypothetical protein